MIEPKTLKGFRDFLPKEARKRQYVIDILKSVFESYGFEPLETPVLEYEEILAGKYGEEGDRLMYKFADRGGRNVALRYDQTVPLARVVAQYGNELPMPFKRYQIQPVWRAENTQKGRFREFLQCDADIVGTQSLLADAEIISLVAKSLDKLGFSRFNILINDRKNFSVSTSKFLSDEDFMSLVRAIDKLKKVGRDEVLEEIVRIGVLKEEAEKLLKDIEQREETGIIQEIKSNLGKMGVNDEKILYYPTLARGLDYYTGMIFEVEIEGYSAGSVCGGGRYDNLIGMFAGRSIPAVGFAFGFDRIIEAMDELNLFPTDIKNSTAKVLITVFSKDLLEKSLEISSRIREVPSGTSLRSNNINTEVWLDPDTKLDKQIKYADKKGIQYVAIIGPDEVQNNTVTLKNLRSGEQKTVGQENLINTIV